MKKITAKIFVICCLCLGFYLVLVFASVFKPYEQVIPKQKRSADKGIYITHYVAQTKERLNSLCQQAKDSGLNTIVVDGKWFLEKPLLSLIKSKKLDNNVKLTPDPWFAEWIKNLQDQGFIVSVRLVVFKDDHLALARPDLAIRLKSGKVYQDLKHGLWANPYSGEVRLYNELIAERAALCGADEVQFDYIRFPAEKSSDQAVYAGQDKLSRVELISQFLASVRQRLNKYNTSIAVDIFGVTAWQSKKDIENLGQDLKQMAKHIDVLCPMLYPSHFHAGYDGFSNPGSEPYYFLNSGVKRIKEILSSEAVVIVPWIQGFNLRSPNFGPDYMLQQTKACKDAGSDHYLIWNARNDYSVSFTALKKRN